MRNPKNQFASAELRFSYTDYPKLLHLNETYQSGSVLLAIWQEHCQCKTPKRYVLFLDSENQLIAWKSLSIRLNYACCAREIAGMALACNASSIIFSHHRLSNAKLNHVDKSLVEYAFKLCERVAVEILDYLIITPNECISYKDWLNAN